MSSKTERELPSDQKYYWVYLPGRDEAGAVVMGYDLADAAIVGSNHLCPDDGWEIQVHELGESQAFIAGEIPGQ